MADMNDLARIIESINNNTGMLQQMTNICGAIKDLNLSDELVNGADGAKVKGNLLKNFCTSALKPVLTGLQTAITEANGLSTETLGPTTGLSGKVDSIKSNIKNIVDGMLGLTNSNDANNPSPFQIADGETESNMSKAINTGQTVKQALSQLKGSVNKISGGLTDFQTTMSTLTIPEIDIDSTDANSLGYKLNALQTASNQIIDTILGFKNGNTTSGDGENAVEVKLSDRVKDIKAASGQIGAFSKALYELKQGASSGAGLIPNLNSFNENLGKDDIKNFGTGNIISNNQLSEKITGSITAGNAVLTYVSNIKDEDMPKWNDAAVKKSVDDKIKAINAAGGLLAKMRDAIYKKGAEAQSTTESTGTTGSTEATGVLVQISDLNKTAGLYDTTYKSIVENLIKANESPLYKIPTGIYNIFETLNTPDVEGSFAWLNNNLKKDDGLEYEEKVKTLKGVGKALDKYKDAIYKDKDNVKSGLLYTVSEFDKHFQNTDVKAALALLGTDGKAIGIVNKITPISSGVSSILASIQKFDDIEGLKNAGLQVQQILKKGNEEVWEDGRPVYVYTDKKDTKADTWVAKVGVASAVLKKLSGSLYTNGTNSNPATGIIPGLNSINTALSKDLDISNITEANFNNITAAVSTTLGALSAFAMNHRMKSMLEVLEIKVSQVKKIDGVVQYDKDKNPIMETVSKKDTQANMYAAKIGVAAAIVKKLSESLWKDGSGGAPSTGLIPYLISLNRIMGRFNSEHMKNITADKFDLFANTVGDVVNGILTFHGRFSQKDIDKLDKVMGMLKGGQSLRIEDVTKLVKGKDGKVDEEKTKVEIKQKGLLTVVSDFVKTMVVFTDPEKGTLAAIKLIDISKLPTSEQLESTFKTLSGHFSIIIQGILNMGLADKDVRKAISLGDETVQKIQSITTAVNAILSAITEMVDPKKNPLISNEKNVSQVKEKINNTFDALVSVISDISIKLKEVGGIVGEMKMEEIEKSYTSVNNVFQTVKSIISIILDMIDSEKNPLAADRDKAKNVISSVESTFGGVSGVVKTTSVKMQNLQNDLSEINLKDIAKTYEDINKIFQGVNNVLAAILNIVDPEKNPLIGRPKVILKVEEQIGQTFESLLKVLKSIKGMMDEFKTHIQELEIEDIEKSYEYVGKIFQSVNTILSTVVDMADPKKNPLIGNPVKVALVKKKIQKTFKALVGVVELIVGEMEAMNKKLEKLNLDEVTKSFESVTKVFTSVNNILKAIIEMPKLMLKFLLAAPVTLAGLVVLGIALGLFWMVLKLISLIKFEKIAEDLSKTEKAFKEITDIFKQLELLFLHVTILALAVIPAIIASIIVGIGLWILNGIFGLIIGSIETMAKMASSISFKDMMNITLVLGFATLVILLFVLTAMAMIQLQEVVVNLKLWPIVGFMLGMIVFVGVLVALGAALAAASAVLIPAAVAIGITVGAMLAITSALLNIALTLEQIQNIKLDAKQISVKAKEILEATKGVYTAVVTMKKEINLKEIKESKNTLKKVKGLVNQVFKLARILDKIDKLVLDGNKIRTNISIVFATANDVISSFGTNGDEFDSNGNKIIKLTPDIIEKNGADFKATLTAFRSIFDDLERLVKILDDVQKVKLDGKVVIDSINVVFQTANEIIDKIVDNENVSLDKLKDDKKEFDKISNQYKAIFEDFAKLTDILVGVDLEKFKNQTNGGFVGIITDIAAASKKLEEVDGDKINKTLNSYGDFLKKVDNVNLKKLETSAKMFEEMAKFSESINGNFDKMADTLNDKIGPLLEDLKNTLNDVHVQVTENGTQAQANTDRIVEKQEIREQMQASGQTQNLTVEEVDRRIDRKYQENVQQRYGIDEIASKLATLIDLFQSGEALVKTT